jgi:hypothetical protein
MLSLEDVSLKFSPSDINSSVKITLFIKDTIRNEIKIRERYIDIEECTVT